MIDPIIVRSSIVLAALLLFAQVVIEILAKLKPQADLHEVRIRTRSWWIMIAVLEAALYGGKETTILLFSCLSFFGLREYLSRVPTRVIDRRVLFWCFLAIPLQYYLIYREFQTAFISFIPVYCIAIIALRLILVGEPKGFVMAMAKFQLGLMFTVYSVGYIAFLTVQDPNRPYEISAGGVLFFIATSQFNDVMQFVSGKTFGKNKIVPKISPKKTVEGLVGGVLITSVVSIFTAPLLTGVSPVTGFIAGLGLGVLGFFGDVLMSAVKRDLGIKDFSQLIPGHGGMLDRIDSLVISAPIYFHIMQYELMHR